MRQRLAVAAAGGALVIALDQLSKAWIVNHIAVWGHPHPAAGAGYHAQVQSRVPPSACWMVPRAGSAGCFRAWRWWSASGCCTGCGGSTGARQRLLCLSLALILAGALGNLIDRLLSGQVVDFILAHWNDAQFPAFNVADSAITVGAALLLLDAFTDGRRSSN